MSFKLARRALAGLMVLAATLVFASVVGAAPSGTRTATTEAAACAALYGVPLVSPGS